MRARYLTIIYVIATIIHHSRIVRAVDCKHELNEAYRSFYADPKTCEATCDDMMTMQHGGEMLNKCFFLYDLLKKKNAEYCLAGRCRSVTPARLHRTKRQGRECGQASLICDPQARYRTLDGSCNNLKNPHWGRANRIQKRLLPPQYADGRGAPRARGCMGQPLPGPRHISNLVHASNGMMRTEHGATYIFMQWGQYLAHDIILTPIATRGDGTPLLCCTTDSSHPACSATIQLPVNDPKFPSNGCMNFVRSTYKYDCSNVRQQINEQSSYVDASQVYGVSKQEGDSLRTFKKGLLKTVNYKLPPDHDDSSCDLKQPFNSHYMYCAKAGDPRVNEQPGLSSLHTLFMREHNRIAEALSGMNPHWEDEKLFQEARKIVVAEHQLITYNEYLPALLGTRNMARYNLWLAGPMQFKDTYRAEADATIVNSYGAAIMRYGHSMINRHVGRMDNSLQMMELEKLEKHFFNPTLYHKGNSKGPEHILRWTTMAACPKLDKFVENSARNELFKDHLGQSFDLSALNIQRGRDHGLPSYNDFREYCGLSRANRFHTMAGGLIDHDPMTAFQLSVAYRCTGDIDLFTGALSERRNQGSVLGPLLQCMVARQFKRLRDGDRFFFERPDPLTGFTLQQLSAIKKIRLSSVLCSCTTPPKYQLNVFQLPDNFSPREEDKLMACSKLPKLDLSAWREIR